MADQADPKPPTCRPLLDWLAASTASSSDDAKPLSDLDAEREARDDVLTEPLEQMRRRWQLIAVNEGYRHLAITLTNPSASGCRRPPHPLEPEHAHMVQALARLRRRHECHAVRFWGHYGRPGTILEPVPFAPIDRFDLSALRLQLRGDPDWWCSLEVGETSSPDVMPLPKPHWTKAVYQELERRAQNGLLEHGVGKEANYLHAWLRLQGIEAPETADTVENYIRPFYEELGGKRARSKPRSR